VSYRAAIGCFGAQVGRARFWFGALPAAVVGVGSLAIAALFVQQLL
jgi:hypothetical protein